MSRRSQASAEGPQVFSWRFENIIGDDGRARVKVTCKNHPGIFAFGSDETTAMRAATEAVRTAAEKADLATINRGQQLTPDGVVRVDGA